MVGAGVLGLPGVMGSLGWYGGVLALVLSLFVSWHTYRLLVLMHEEPDLESKDGSGYKRYDRYQDLTTHLLGKNLGWWSLVPFQNMVLVGICITYTVVGGDDLHGAVAELVPAGQAPPAWAFYLIFGGAQLLLSQLPDFSALGAVSLLGAAMSAGYCGIAVVLSALHSPEPGASYNPVKSKGQVFDVFNALSTIMFAYGGHNIALEIQATLPNPPTVTRMMRGVHIAFVLTGIAYFGVAISGFRAMGLAAGSNIILSLSNGPVWVRVLARLMVVVHVGAAFQVYAHPAFEAIESSASKASGGSVGRFAVGYDGGHFAPRLVIRSAYVLACTFVACLLPFFGDLMGLVGAVAITPTTFMLPAILWLYWKKPQRWGAEWALNVLIAVVTLIIGVIGAIASVYLIVMHVGSYRIFATR